jgi:hypothetical protein
MNEIRSVGEELVMTDTEFYSMTDAMVYCMQQSGAAAVAFVELKSGMAIAGDGIENVDIDAMTPFLTQWMVAFSETNDGGDPRILVPEVAITMGKHFHMLHPLKGDASDLYLYLAMDRESGSLPLGRRCLTEIASKLKI